MKLTLTIFITSIPINKHLSHASQMHTHAYIWRVCNSEPYSGIQGLHKHLWTLVDPDMYMRRVDIFPHNSLCFSFLISFQKTLSSPTSLTIVWHVVKLEWDSNRSQRKHQENTTKQHQNKLTQYPNPISNLPNPNLDETQQSPPSDPTEPL